MNIVKAEDLYKGGYLSELDFQFAGLIGRLDGRGNHAIILVACLVSRGLREGNICVDLSKLSDLTFDFAETERLTCPSLNSWLKDLKSSPAVGEPGDYRPLILNGSRLYLFRYWDYEKKLSDILKKHANGRREIDNESNLRSVLERIFPSRANNEKKNIDWQKIAAFVALRSGLSVISGGPGSGKTYTIARILTILIEQSPDSVLNILLAAPTGKAAVKLQEAIKEAKTTLNCRESVKKAIPDEASTIHRLLRTIPNSPYFHYNEQNPLPADVIVIDEASMLDLALFAKLAQAIRPQSRLILLGDKDQLASVEVGSVFGDICDTGNIHPFSPSFIDICRRVTGEEIIDNTSCATPAGISDCILQLRKNYRFREASGIHVASQAVNAGKGIEALSFIRDGHYDDIVWKRLPKPDELKSHLEEWLMDRYADYLKALDPREMYEKFNRFRILCVLHEGFFGVENLNVLVEQIMRRKGLVDPNRKWYQGRPVIITRNDYNLGLFNGDIGITIFDCVNADGPRVFFPKADGSVKNYPPMRLPEYETAYAMTVHKSQGSEFEEILFIMPDRDVPILTRELIYTAITRVKNRIEIWSYENIFTMAVERRIVRSSGLRDALWVDD